MKCPDCGNKARPGHYDEHFKELGTIDGRIPLWECRECGTEVIHGFLIRTRRASDFVGNVPLISEHPSDVEPEPEVEEPALQRKWSNAVVSVALNSWDRQIAPQTLRAIDKQFQDGEIESLDWRKFPKFEIELLLKAATANSWWHDQNEIRAEIQRRKDEDPLTPEEREIYGGLMVRMHRMGPTTDWDQFTLSELQILVKSVEEDRGDPRMQGTIDVYEAALKRKQAGSPGTADP